MDITVLQRIMIKHGVSIRAIPSEVISIHEVRHIDKYPNGHIYYDEYLKRDMLRVKRIPKYAGKILIVKNCGTNETIKFSKPKYYDSIEEAINELG